MNTNIHILYRISDKGNPKEKLENASKEACLKNAIHVFKQAHILVFADNCEMETLDMIRKYGIEPNSISLGNAKSWRHVALYAIDNFKDNDIVYFLEDDYLHLEEAETALIEGIKIADYVTLYDHPGNYLTKKQGGNPLVKDGGEVARVVYSESTHWKHTNSTTMTFATTVRILKEDYPIFHHGTRRKIPQDFKIFKRLIGHSGLKNRLFGKRRVLVSPIPSKSTHAEVAHLAPLINWDEII